MDYLKSFNQKIAKISLGTVQFGMKYGIANINRPSLKEIEKILFKAFEEGINILDTAREYGESEEIIGNILNKYPKKSEILISSKLGKLNYENIEKQIEIILDKSLHSLCMDNIYIYLLHDPRYMKLFDGLIIEKLKKQKEKGKISHLGVSIYTPLEAEQALNIDEIEVIQVPFNVLDNRLLKIDFFNRAREKGKLVFVRSIYLQGLLFLISQNKVPEKFLKYDCYFKKLNTILNSLKISVGELALKYALKKSQGTVVLGVNSYEQLRENLIFMDKKDILDADFEDITRTFLNVPEELVDPRKWSF